MTRRKRFGLVVSLALLIAGLLAWSQPRSAQAAVLGNLSAYWKLDETTGGATVADTSGNGNSGTPSNSPTPSTSLPTTSFTNARSLGFNGTNQVVTVPSSSTTNFTGSFTMAWWMNPTAWNNSSSAGILSKKNDSPSAQAGYVIYDDGSTNCPSGTSCQPYLNLRLKGASNNYDYLYSASSVTVGTWQHWAVVFDATAQTLKWYKNGVLDKTYTSINPGDMSNATDLLIGETQNWSGFYNGKLDDIRLYNRPLGSTEVGALGAGNNTAAMWTAAGSTSDWGTGTNWDTGYVPDAGTDVTITTRGVYPALTQAASAGSLTVNSGTYFNLNGFNFSLGNSSAIANHGTVVSKNSETTAPVDGSDGTVMYTNTGSTTGLKLGNGYKNLIVNDGMLGYWKLDEASESSVADSSGYGNTMNPLTTVPTASTTVPGVTFADTRSGAFNGSSTALAIADNGNFSNTGDVTISAWVKFNSIGTQTIAGKWRVGVKQQYLLQLNGNGKLAFWTGDGAAGATDNLESAATVSTGTWYHVTGVMASGTKSLYVNGVLSSSHAAAAYGVSTGIPWTIGGKLGSGGFYFEYLDGSVDDVRLYGRALGSGEIGRLGAGGEPAGGVGTATLGAAVAVSGNLVLNSGTLDVSGSNYGVSVGGNFENNGGVFTPRSGTVTLAGGDQTINSSNTFYNLVKAPSTSCTLLFGAGSTTTVGHDLTLSGTGVMALNSTTFGTQWKLSVAGTATVSTGQLQDSNNLGAVITATGMANGGNNFGWNISPPSAPSNLGPTGKVDGSYTASTQPALNFDLSDPDPGDTVKYQIQVDDSSNFGSPVVDYTGALGAGGTQTFTVGQAAGSGSYTVGSNGQTLAGGAYYWRVRALDSGGNASSYTVARSGSVAFNVDVTAPTNPGAPSTTSPTSSNTPTWTWTASTDSGAGLGPGAYTVQWSTDSTFTTGVSGDTASTNSYQNAALADGTWYFRVRATDVAGNASAFSTAGTVYINTLTIAGSNSLGHEPGVMPITDLQIGGGTGNPTVAVKLLVSNGTLSFGSTTGLTFTGGSSGGTLYFSGTKSALNTALATLQYTRNTTGTDTLEVSLVQPGEVFFGGTGHLYEYVSSTTTWSQAETQAAARSKYGAIGYLTTITSSGENDFVAARLANAGWMGASDVASEGTWKWVEGPESGTTFSTGNSPSMTAAPGQYQNWNGGEPNDSGGNEDCGQFLSGGTGKWNDLPCSGTTLPGYVVEYGAPGNSPLVPAKNISINTNDVTPPTDPGSFAVTGGSPTVDSTPTWTWTAASDAGSGLANPAYTVQWSLSSSFASGVNSATTNALTYTPSALADGLWYFRVRAADVQTNASNWVMGSVLIDTTPPSVPTTPSTATPTNSATPTWTWPASTDAGAGLTSPAYTVQWSQSATFASGVTTDVTNATSFTQPASLADGTWYFRVRAADALNNISAFSNAGSVVIDSVVPLISHVASGGVADATATVTWSTDKATSSRVHYGPSTNYDTWTSLANTSPRVTSHSLVLPDLVSCTTYHFQVESADASGNTATGADQSFMTTGCAGSAVVTAQTAVAASHTAGATVGLASNGTGVQVTAPANFTGQDVTLQVKHLQTSTALAGTGVPLGWLVAGNYIYDIKALLTADTAVTSFLRPVTVRISYNDVDVPGLVESSLAIWRWDEGSGWQKLNGCAVDEFLNTVTCTTTGFSTFGLFGSPPAVASAGSTMTHKPVAVATTPEPTVSAAPTPHATATPSPQASPAAGGGTHTAGTSTWWLRWWLWSLCLVLGWWLLAAARRRRRRRDEGQR